MFNLFLKPHPNLIESRRPEGNYSLKENATSVCFSSMVPTFQRVSLTYFPIKPCGLTAIVIVPVSSSWSPLCFTDLKDWHRLQEVCLQSPKLPSSNTTPTWSQAESWGWRFRAWTGLIQTSSSTHSSCVTLGISQPLWASMSYLKNGGEIIVPTSYGGCEDQSW